MENIFKELKEKIENYKKILEVNTIEVDNSTVLKIEDEIKTLKSKIDELNASMEGKSKIEKMKITLNVSSIESEISLKEMDLEEKKEKSKNEYENKVKSHNSELEETKKDIENFITDSEDKIENNIKNSDNLILQKNNFGSSMSAANTILLGNDLEEVKGYCKNILGVEQKNLKDIMSQENVFNQKIENINTEIKDLKEERMNLLKKADYWYSKYPTNFWGDYDEDKADEYRENGEEAQADMNRCSDKIILKANDRDSLQKELDKLKIRREAIENKIKTIDEMVDEMIKEVIKEELKKREIVIPNFVSVTKYFNAPDEVEE